MARSAASSSDQILLFPYGDIADDAPGKEARSQSAAPARGTSVVLCGTYRKDPEGLRQTFELLKDTGFSVLSPSNPFIETEEHGFVYMRQESMQTPYNIENKHLDAIQQADFVWFFAPDGYVGPTGALEVGFARAAGVPVYTNTNLNDVTIKNFVEVVESPLAVLEAFKHHRVLPPSPAIKSFQHYYRRAALQRGFARENAKDCLLLMVEEVGELARALRKRMKLARHGKPIHNQEELELADVFLYVVHMANILKIDLASVVQRKELLNIQKLIHGG
jgi:NTP pyrophosphatase (non-canonical NTP hydrolase)